MKANKTFYLMCIFALLMIASFIWAIVDYSWWSGVTFLVLFFITGWLGYEYAFKVKKDLKGAIDSFMGKTSIIILLVGLSLACNGQNRFDNEFQKDSSNFSDIKRGFFNENFPIVTINKNEDEIKVFGVEVCTVNLLLEYKKECFNDSIPEIIESYLCATNDVEHAEWMFKRMSEEPATYKMFDSFMLEVMTEPFDDNNILVTNGINYSRPLQRYEKYRIKTVRTKYNHKQPSFPDFLNWIEKRKTK